MVGFALMLLVCPCKGKKLIMLRDMQKWVDCCILILGIGSSYYISDFLNHIMRKWPYREESIESMVVCGNPQGWKSLDLNMYSKGRP